MHDQDVIERLRSDLRTERDGTRAPDWLLDAGRRRWRRRRARRTGLAVAAAALVVVGLAGLAGGRGQEDSVDTGPADPAPAPTVETTRGSTTTTTGPAPTTPLPTGPPSQSPEDAARDGIVPSVAALPLAARVDPQAEVDAPEGTWTISVPADADGLVCEDPHDGRVYGVDWVCGTDYDEVLLRDRSGAIVRAYPMIGISPSWIHVTPDAVLGGRIGDGGQPSSSLFRIDRETLALSGLVFPFTETGLPEGGIDGLVPSTQGQWRIAADESRYSGLVTYGPDAVGTDVTSHEGTVRVDVAGIETLFAEAAQG